MEMIWSLCCSWRYHAKHSVGCYWYGKAGDRIRLAM